MKYVWFDIETGAFSNSWDEDTHQKYLTPDMIEHARLRNVKLIQYKCLTDDDFELYNLMKIVTNINDRKSRNKGK